MFLKAAHLLASDETSLCNDRRCPVGGLRTMMNDLRGINSLFSTSGHAKLPRSDRLMVVQVCEQPRRVQLSTVWEDAIVRGFAKPIHHGSVYNEPACAALSETAAALRPVDFRASFSANSG